MKSKFFALLALVMVFAVICTMGIAVFADDSAPADDTATSEDSVDDTATSEDATDDTTTTGSETADDTSSETTDDSSSTKEEKEPTWWDNYNQIIGWILAAIILVAIVFVSFWWIKSGFKPSKK